MTPQDVAPALTPGTPAQGLGAGIGQQGTTAIGQPGTTAIGQQGVGMAITPQTNGIVIGEPEPITPGPAQAPPIGLGTNMQNRAPAGVPVAPQSKPGLPAPAPRRR